MGHSTKAKHVENRTSCSISNFFSQKTHKCSTEENDYVFDPYAGSGSALVAAAIENRIGIGAEIDKNYCKIIKKRMKELNDGTLQYREDIEVPSPKGKVSQMPLEWD